MAEKSVFASKLESLGYGKASLIGQRCQSAVFGGSVDSIGQSQDACKKTRPESSVKVLRKKKPLLLKYIGSETKKLAQIKPITKDTIDANDNLAELNTAEVSKHF